MPCVARLDFGLFDAQRHHIIDIFHCGDKIIADPSFLLSKEERTFQAPFFTCLAMNTAKTLQITSMTAEKRNTFIQPI